MDVVAPHQGLIPPRRFRQVGGGDFTEIGQRWVSELKELAGLRPSGAVLDIGCGSGRIAIPLLDYLDERGTYHGFDVVPEWVAWCQEHISRRNPWFEFARAEVRNAKYNPSGPPASQYRFPYEAESFDVAMAISVFTHLTMADLRNYVAEAGRVLKPGGRLLATFFIVDAANESAPGSAKIDFSHRDGDCYVADPGLPELIVGYEEDRVRDTYHEAGLEVLEPIRYGSWSGRAGRTRQDIVVARKGMG